MPPRENPVFVLEKSMWMAYQAITDLQGDANLLPVHLLISFELCLNERMVIFSSYEDYL